MKKVVFDISTLMIITKKAFLDRNTEATHMYKKQNMWNEQNGSLDTMLDYFTDSTNNKTKKNKQLEELSL